VAFDAFGLSWSPDGRYLAFVGLPDGASIPTINTEAPRGDPPTDVFIVVRDGTGERNVTESAAFETGPAWSPDGTRLAYRLAEDGIEYRLATLPMDGQVPSGPAVEGPPSESFAWSPDSSLLLSVLSPTIASVDAEFREAPRVLIDVSSLPQTDPLHPATYSIESCAPSWRSIR
jgi:dipeptidyl aminopeptidase/acylaminoacyl peptidase